jgi:hypothetical protein
MEGVMYLRQSLGHRPTTTANAQHALSKVADASRETAGSFVNLRVKSKTGANCGANICLEN